MTRQGCRVSKFKAVVLIVFAVALLAPAAEAGSTVRAVVKFSAATSQSQRVGTVRSAGGRVVKVRGTRVVARMSSGSANSLRAAMGVISVRY